MSAETFLDTNIFIYQVDSRDPVKSDIANTIIRQGIESGDACISFQVIQECLNTITRKADIPLSGEHANQYLDTVLAPLFQVRATLDLYHRGLDIQSRYRYGFYDSLIIAAALQAGCQTLLSEDLQNGQVIESLTIKNPFLSSTF